jgi:ABC-type bacteriocin/lantibiotic exporter with double-glycine peptidase domain
MDAERLRATLAATSALRTRVVATSGWHSLFDRHKHPAVTLVGLSLIDALLIASEEFGRSAERDQLLAALPVENNDLNPIAAPIALAKVDLHGAWQETNWKLPLKTAAMPQIVKVQTGGYAVVLRVDGPSIMFVRAAGFSGLCQLNTLVTQTQPRALVVSTISGARYRRPQNMQPNHTATRRLVQDSFAHAGLRKAVFSRSNIATSVLMAISALAISAVSGPVSVGNLSKSAGMVFAISASTLSIIALHLFRRKNDWKSASSVVTDVRQIFLRSFLGQQASTLVDVTASSRAAAHQLMSALRLWALDVPALAMVTLCTIAGVFSTGTSLSIGIMVPHACLAAYFISLMAIRMRRTSGLLRILRALDANRQTVLERVRGDIALDCATLVASDSDTSIIAGLNIRIRAGERIGIIGSTGAGKTTLLRALAGQLALEKGRRYVDGQPRASTFDPVQREQISYAAQDALVVRGTISDNVLMGRATPLPGMIDWIVRACNLSSLLKRGPQGWQQPINDITTLSSGERQAIGLARALAGDPAVLLLDEPTATMDAQAEQAFLSAITNDTTRRTLVIASNRQSVLRLMDRIIWLEAGRIIADKSGTEMLQSLTAKATRYSSRSAA